MNKNLEKINQEVREIAETYFLNCCGSQKWARMMREARPFRDAAEMLQKGEHIWQTLDSQDWLEAFAAHPKIGARANSQQSEQFAKWSHTEQAGARAATDSVRDELARANHLYEEKFGYIFIVCATGKTAEEMLEICRRRLRNEADEEIRIAAAEQQKITEIRLKKLLEIE